jgi:hypothetical protein
MPPVGFEPAIPASERTQTHALDRAATGIGIKLLSYLNWWPADNSTFQLRTQNEANCHTFIIGLRIIRILQYAECIQPQVYSL